MPRDSGAPADDVVRAAYAARSEEYTAALGSVSAMDPRDVRFISDWAAGCRGPVVDAGCGPGHWSHRMAELGVDVEGVDLVPEFVDLARARFPTVRYRVGRLDDLGLPDGTTAGILAWYSLIHLDPARLPVVLDEFRRCLRADGTLAVGLYESDRLEQFPHTVTPAWSWPVDEVTQRIEDAGFVIRHTEGAPNPRRPDRRHVALVAELARTSSGSDSRND